MPENPADRRDRDSPFSFSLSNTFSNTTFPLPLWFSPCSRLPVGAAPAQESVHILRGEAQTGHGHRPAGRHRGRVRRRDRAAQAADAAPQLQPDPRGLRPHQRWIQLLPGQAHLWVPPELPWGQGCAEEFTWKGCWWSSLSLWTIGKKNHLERVTIELNPILGVHHLDLVECWWSEFSVSHSCLGYWFSRGNNFIFLKSIGKLGLTRLPGASCSERDSARKDILGIQGLVCSEEKW